MHGPTTKIHGNYAFTHGPTTKIHGNYVIIHGPTTKIHGKYSIFQFFQLAKLNIIDKLLSHTHQSSIHFYVKNFYL